MIDYDFDNFDSDFLCQHCGGLLYLDNANPPNGVCITENCPLWPNDVISLINATETEEPRIFQEIQEQEGRLVNKIKQWKPGRVVRYAYKARRELIASFITQGVLPLADHFIALGELLLMANKYPSEGSLDNVEDFWLLLERVRMRSRDRRNLEDVQNRRLVFGRTKSDLKPFYIKYAKAFSEFQKGLGLVSRKQPRPGEFTYKYDHLITAVTPDLDFSNITDGNEILERFWPISLTLRYALQEHYVTKMQYNYRPDVLDFTVLFGWMLKSWGIEGSPIIPADKWENELADMQNHFDQQAKGRYSAVDFFSTYVDSTELVPIVARTPEGIIMDHHTLLFFLFYLQACPDPEQPAIKERGQIIQDMREKVAAKFEEWLRAEVRSLGFMGPETAINETFEYDIIAISEEKKVILMADAKYRDIAPSSFTGENLTSQELLGDHGLKYEADRQQQRLDHFRQNMGKFDKYLKPERPWEDYEIQGFLVTKLIPLAYRYKEVMILPATEFLKTVS